MQYIYIYIRKLIVKSFQNRYFTIPSQFETCFCVTDSKILFQIE